MAANLFPCIVSVFFRYDLWRYHKSDITAYTWYSKLKGVLRGMASGWTLLRDTFVAAAHYLLPVLA